jgi:hypothetical protein
VPNNLAGSINDAVIRRLADAQSYQRGLDYYSHGNVESLEDQDESVRAVVRGNQDYTVMLAADEGVLDYSCDCPVGSDGKRRRGITAAHRGCGPTTIIPRWWRSSSTSATRRRPGVRRRLVDAPIVCGSGSRPSVRKNSA